MNKFKATFLASLLILCSIAFLPKSTAQQDTKTISIAGLKDRVTIRRDERGIPYIEAKNDDDLYFAQGYVTASDRLWQMDLLRRNVRGELAEIFGAGALGEDKRHRTMGLTAVAGLAMGTHNVSLDPGAAKAARCSTESFDPCQNPTLILE